LKTTNIVESLKRFNRRRREIFLCFELLQYVLLKLNYFDVVAGASNFHNTAGPTL
jgi:hypothetical protein